jgi:phage gp37-like protein
MDFEQVEDNMITALKTGMTYLRTCETYAGQLEGDLEHLIINAPAAFVVFNGSPIERVDNLNFKQDVSFSVLLVSEDPRGKAALRKDSATGCYRMIKDTLKFLANNKLGLEVIFPLAPEKVYLSFITQRHACYGVSFGTNFDSKFT